MSTGFSINKKSMLFIAYMAIAAFLLTEEASAFHLERKTPPFKCCNKLKFALKYKLYYLSQLNKLMILHLF